MPRFHYVPRAGSRAPSVPFADAEEAWFWFIRCHRVRRAGARLAGGPTDTVRPCDPDDIYRPVKRWKGGSHRRAADRRPAHFASRRRRRTPSWRRGSGSPLRTESWIA
jgi:hypothetical protein